MCLCHNILGGGVLGCVLALRELQLHFERTLCLSLALRLVLALSRMYDIVELVSVLIRHKISSRLRNTYNSDPLALP